MGELYSQFATVVTICLVLSVIESKLILPSHLAHLNTRQTPGKNPIQRSWMWVQKITDQSLNLVNEHIYGPLIKIALHHRYAVLVVFVGIFIFVISMPLTGMVRMSFFPDIPGDTVRAELTMKNDASYGQTHAALTLLESRAHEADRELLHAKDDENSAIEYLQVLSEADQSGSVKLQLTKDALRIELRSSDDTVLTQAGETLKNQSSIISAVSGIEDNLEPGQPQLYMELTPQGRALGFSTDMLAEQVLQAFSGQVVQRFQRSTDEVEVKVRYYRHRSR
ncbi:efflux RND transporter permease subunit [Desulfobacter curvatus]|uniref:efflux RND transporter permease subunit n=1 Tax=Desulfobacter curvatus TaxID=2290 RepID=UPI0003AAAA31|nr:efflux RND transporter permease subunit [Desulfobacter curvatus]